MLGLDVGKYCPAQENVIPICSGLDLTVTAGSRIRVEDMEGAQICEFLAIFCRQPDDSPEAGNRSGQGARAHGEAIWNGASVGTRLGQ